MNDTTFRTHLEHFLSAKLGTTARLLALERSTEGFSQETFAFDVETAAGRRGYVAKREPVAGLLEPYDLEPEFRVLNALGDDPFPSPPTPWFERDPAVLERPFYVMEKLVGDVPIPSPDAEGRGPFTEAERVALAPQIVDALARLHALDWQARGLGFLGAPAPADAPAREVARWAARIDASRLPMEPIIAEALVWLRGHLPDAGDVTLVHGDYRTGNFLVERAEERSRLVGVLDWEMVHLGDPIEDVAWFTSGLWRAGTPWAGGLLEPEAYCEAYTRASGRPVDPARLRFWEVLALVKMLAIMQTGIRAFRDGRTTDLRMAIFNHQMPGLAMLLAMTRGLEAA